jgi:hypothetical protein
MTLTPYAATVYASKKGGTLGDSPTREIHEETFERYDNTVT